MNTSPSLMAAVALVSLSWAGAILAQDDELATHPSELIAEDIFDKLKPLAVRAETPEPQRADENPLVPIEPIEPVVPELPGAEPQAPEQAEAAASGPLSPALRDLLVPLTSNTPNQSGAPLQLRAQQPGELTRLNNDELRALIAYAAGALASDLEKIEHSERWRKFLQVDELSKEFGTSAAADREDARWQTTLQRYEKVNTDEQYRVICDRWSYQTLRLALAEYLAPADGRETRRKLHESISQLKQTLERSGSGAHLGGILELPDLSRLATSPGQDTVAQRKPLKLILARFDQAAADPRYGAVTSLGGFREIQEQLRMVTASIDNDGSPVAISPEDAALRLTAVGGASFQRLPQTQNWLPVDGTRIITTQSSIKTGDDGTARLAVGQRMAVQLEPACELTVEQFIDDEHLLVTRLNVVRGKLKIVSGGEADLLIPRPQGASAPRRSFTTRRIVIAADGYTLSLTDVDFAIEFERIGEPPQSLATIFAGSAKVEHAANGDNVTVRAGRQAVLVPSGVAVRAAATRPADWWPSEAPATTATRQPAPSR